MQGIKELIKVPVILAFFERRGNMTTFLILGRWTEPVAALGAKLGYESSPLDGAASECENAIHQIDYSPLKGYERSTFGCKMFKGKNPTRITSPDRLVSQLAC
ncbi:hypothetical protein TNCV_3177191 [Trichonephila clavipes]|nr:hypothetical protein TNCV_3177191 [Trichonephila clavipes]